MGWNINDLNQGVKNIERVLEERTDRRAQEFADRVMGRRSSTQSQETHYAPASRYASPGRGAWVLFLWPAWLIIAFFGYGMSQHLLHGLGDLGRLLSPVAGIALAIVWYRSGFTRRHPFLGSVIGVMAVIFLTGIVLA